MNKIQREIYIVLSNEIDHVLCSFCKYIECISGESPCDSGEPYCIHPLLYRLEEQWGYGIEPGDDCWGFRPRYNISDMVDIVGIILQNNWDIWWTKTADNGVLRINGVRL